jgi:putative endonuclease
MKEVSDTKLLGENGEDLACEYLVQKGYKILCRNYWAKLGEIDIIARKKHKLFDFLIRKNSSTISERTIHFIEVKTLSESGVFHPEDHFDYKKQNKYRRLVEIWLNNNKYPLDYPCQVDLIAVSGSKIDFFDNVIGG